jgi:hypothetical protein
MRWSLLLPSTWNPFAAIRGLFDANPQAASQALSDVFILITVAIAAVFALWSLMLTVASWWRTRRYLLVAAGLAEDAAGRIAASPLLYFRELRHHLLEVPMRDGSGRTTQRRTVDAAEVFRDSAFAPGFASSRFFLAIPGILTGLGVLGTFVGLQLGIGGLDLSTQSLSRLDTSIVPLIQGCAVAFSTSVWGVVCSLAFSGVEKLLEGFALGRIRKLQNRVDALFPRYVPEEAMSELERSSRESANLLRGLAVAIGEEMQKAIGRLGAEIKEAVSNATAEGQGPLMEKSAELLSNALTSELVKLKEQIGSMADQFSERFSGASDGLLQSIRSFQPTVEALSGAVGDAQRTVAEAVGKLNAHESVMREMSEATANVRQVAEAFAAMRETLATSTTQNQEAARAQLAATQGNERVAEQFSQIGERLPELRQTLEDAARVIGSLGAPIAELQVLLQGQPELQRQLDDARATSEAERSQLLLKMSGDLAEKVGHAAEQFGRVSELAEKLEAAANSLNAAGSELATFGQNVLQASKEQRDASEASRAAAASGERVAIAFEPLPAAITSLTGGLQTAGDSVRAGAETSRDSYRELINLQKQWFAGAELGLNAMKDRLQTLLKAYGDQIEGQTRNLMKQWTDEVAECLQSYETQVSELQGGIDELQAALSALRK